MRILIERSTLKVLIVMFVLVIVCCALGYCTTHAASCTPLRVCNPNVVPPITTACETPTPVITWDQVPDSDLKGYTIYYAEADGVPQLMRDINCVWDDRSDPPDGVKETRTCIGPDVWLALQREGTFTPFTAYTFWLKAIDTTGNRSLAFSDPLPMCFRPICVKPGPCN